MSVPFKEIHNRILSDSKNKTNPSVPINSQIYSVSLEKIFSQQFFQKIKSQISQKIKPSKSVLEALKHSNELNQSYKEQIKRLNAHIDLLIEKNKEVNDSINILKCKENEYNLTKSIKSQPRLQIVILEPICIQNKNTANSSISIEILKQKIMYLEQIKTLKEGRYQQMIEKEATLKGEINFLMHQNDSLLNKIRNLEDMLQKYQQGPSLNTSPKKIIPMKSINLQKKQLMEVSAFESISQSKYSVQMINNPYTPEDDEKFKIYVNQRQRMNEINSGIREQSDNQSDTIPLDVPYEEDLNLMVSNTQAVEIKDQYDIEILATQKLEKQKAQKDFNEIDGLLEQQIPNTDTISDINSDRKQQNDAIFKKMGKKQHKVSFIQINTDISQSLMQSQIQITVDK